MSGFFTVNDVETTFAPCARVNASEARARGGKWVDRQACGLFLRRRPQILDNFALSPRIISELKPRPIQPPSSHLLRANPGSLSFSSELHFFNIHRESNKNLASDGLKGVRSSVRLRPFVKRHFERGNPGGLYFNAQCGLIPSFLTPLCDPARGADFIVKEPPPFDNILHRPGDGGTAAIVVLLLCSPLLAHPFWQSEAAVILSRGPSSSRRPEMESIVEIDLMQLESNLAQRHFDLAHRVAVPSRFVPARMSETAASTHSSPPQSPFSLLPPPSLYVWGTMRINLLVFRRRRPSLHGRRLACEMACMRWNTDSARRRNCR